MSISHLLPAWFYCERHDDVFRDFRVHVDCDTRLATDEEIARGARDCRISDPLNGE